jgi:Bacterial SH3 domain
MKSRLTLFCLMALAALTACTANPTATETIAPTLTAATPTSALDACDKSNVQSSIKPYTDLTREFDDTSYVASFTPQAQLVEPVLKLQDVKRRVQLLEAPDCFTTLKKLQVDYMNGVITALVHFLGGAKGEQVQAEIAATRSLRTLYEQELANVLGTTFVPPPTNPPQPTAPPATATPGITPAATPEPVSLSVIQRANLRNGPGTNFEQVGTMNAGETSIVVGRTEAGDWLQVIYPADGGTPAWLLASLVTVTGPVETLPVITP